MKTETKTSLQSAADKVIEGDNKEMNKFGRRRMTQRTRIQFKVQRGRHGIINSN